MSDRRVTVRIDRLVLHAESAVDRRSLGAAVEGELARAIAAGGLPRGLGESAELPTVRARMAPPRSPGARAQGAAIATAVYRGLGG
jgi:hypothetical protein